MDKSVSNEFLHALCTRWVDWLRTRRLLAPCKLGAGSTLGRFVVSRSYGEPNGPMSGELNRFDRAVHALDESPSKAAFWLYYVEGRTVEWVSSECGVPKREVYRMIEWFSRKAWVRSEQFHDVG